MMPVTLGRFSIRPRVVRVAYPRNGNVDNPTAIKAYDLYEGDTLMLSCSTLSEAKAHALAPYFARVDGWMCRKCMRNCRSFGAAKAHLHKWHTL